MSVDLAAGTIMIADQIEDVWVVYAGNKRNFQNQQQAVGIQQVNSYKKSVGTP